MRIVLVLLLALTAAFYHYHGANDWFAWTAVSDDLTPAQMTNELISTNMLILMAIVLAAPRPEKP